MNIFISTSPCQGSSPEFFKFSASEKDFSLLE